MEEDFLTSELHAALYEDSVIPKHAFRFNSLLKSLRENLEEDALKSIFNEMITLFMDSPNYYYKQSLKKSIELQCKKQRIKLMRLWMALYKRNLKSKMDSEKKSIFLFFTANIFNH